MRVSRWHNLFLAVVLLPAISLAQQPAQVQPSAAAVADLDWFFGPWNIVYEDALLGPVHGRAVVAAGKQGLDVQVRLRDPRTGTIETLKHSGAARPEIKGGMLELQLQGRSPASGFVDKTVSRATRVLRLPAGAQLSARLEGAKPAWVAIRTRAGPFVDPNLSLRIPFPAGAREALKPEWTYSIHRPADMASNRAGEVVKKDGRSFARGVESWVRPAAIVTGATDLDLPSPARLAAIQKDKRLPGGKSAATAERAALEARWGPETYAVAWLRVDGADLPVQPKRALLVDFEDAGIVWTGESRPHQRNPESLDIRVQVLKGVAAGPKWFTLNGSAGEWDYGIEPVAIRHLRDLSVAGAEPAGEADKPDFDSASEFYLGEVFSVEVEYASEPSFSTRVFASRIGDGPPLRYETRKVPGLKTIFRSAPILLDDGMPVDAAAEEGAAPSQPVGVAIPARAGTVLRTEEPEAMAPSRGRAIALSAILAQPPSLWNEAMKTAAECRRSGRAPEEISRRIIREGFAKRSLAVSLEDHAAALLLRDELALELTNYAKAESKARARGGVMHSTYTAQLINDVRLIRRPPIADIEVWTPDDRELIPLHNALTAEMESRWFKGDRKAFFHYAQDVVDTARGQLADRAESASATVAGIDDCDVERILATVRAGLGPVVANVQQKLLRRPRGGEPGIPRWVPDRSARNHVGSLGVLAEAVKAQSEYSSIDTDVVIAVATVATLGAGGLIELATVVGSDALGAALVQTAADAALLGAALDVVDLGFMANDFAGYSDALAEVRLAEGLVVVGGDARLKQAREDAENKAFGLQVGGAMLAGAGTASAIQVARKGTSATSVAAATPGSASPPAPPPAGAAQPVAPVAPAAPDAPRTVAAAPSANAAQPPPQSATTRKPGGVLDRPEFHDLPEKPPAESPDLESYMTPEELAARPPPGEGSTNPPKAKDTVIAEAATVLEPGRTRKDSPASTSAGPTGTAIDPARVRPEPAKAATASGDYAIDLDKPGGIEKLDEQRAASRQAAESQVPTEGGLLGRPGFRELPKKPQAEAPDLDPYRSAEELAERERLKQMDTAALPAVQPEAAAAVDAKASTADLPAATESRIARSNEDTNVNQPGPETPEDRLAAPDEDTDVLPAAADTKTSLPRRKDPETDAGETPEAEDRLAAPDEDTDVMPAARGEQPEVEDRFAGPDEETDVLPAQRPRDDAPPRPEEFDPTSQESGAGLVAPPVAEEFHPHPLQRDSRYRDLELEMGDGRRAWDIDHEVKIYNAQELENFRVVADSNGKLIYAQSGRPVNCRTGIYVMDIHGNVFVHGSPQYGAIHHSSLAGGKRPAGAGEIWVDNGRIRTLNENSGHYSAAQPKGRVFEVVRELASQDVNTKGIVVDTYAK